MYRNTKNRMKKGYISLLAALVCGIAWAEDNNTFYFTDAAVMPGEMTNIELCMRNTATDLTCLEAEIQLPEGLSVVCDVEGNPIAALYRNRMREHELLTNVLDNGNFKLLVSSIDGKLITGEDGPLLCFCVQAAETAPLGECTVETVGESLLVNSGAKAYYSVGVTGNVLITDDATSINEGLRVKDEDLDAAIYDLNGRKIDSSFFTNRHSSLKKGIYIKGGKKEIVR